MTDIAVPLNWMQRSLARGFRCTPPPAEAVVWNSVHYATGAEAVTGGSAVFLPTLGRRLDASTCDRIAANVGAEVIELQRLGFDVSLYVIVQYLANETRSGAEAARRRLVDRFAKLLTETGASVDLHSAVMRGPGKVQSLNAMIEHARSTLPEAAILLDDDVDMEPGCLSALVDRYGQMDAPVAIGATKIGNPADDRGSRLLHWAKSHTAPATQYPHACCMIVTMTVIADGFPPALSSDDGFICFELLDPSAPNPLARLQLDPRARVHHVVGGERGDIIRRIRRMLLNHYQFLCSYSWDKGRFYCRDLLFFGFWPIGKRMPEGTVLARARRWCLKLLYFMWFVSVGMELALRALIRRPIRMIRWGAGTEDNQKFGELGGVKWKT